MGNFAQLWLKAVLFQYFRSLKVCTTMSRDDGETVAAASCRRSRMPRLIDDDGICATIERVRIRHSPLLTSVAIGLIRG